MKIRLAVFSLLTVLVFLLSVRTMAAQTNPSAEDKNTSIHTLSESQTHAIKRIQVESDKKAALAALKLAGIVGKIYENMLADKPDEELRASLSAEMKEATWELLTIKGQAIRETIALLTPEEKQLIRSEMRKPGVPADLSEVITHTFRLADK